MQDRGLFLTWRAIRRQLTAMPNELYLIRLIHRATRRSFPGERLWTAAQLTTAATIRFLRLRNREGCDIYIHPYAGDRNAGYILLDLDAALPGALEAMRDDGLNPCLVIQTSPGHLQAWLHIREGSLEPALATAVARHVAGAYGGDMASADWRHLGRLAGFTNQKPARLTPSGYPPWVTVRYARAGLASHAEPLLRSLAVLTSAPCAPGLRNRHSPPYHDEALVVPAAIPQHEAVHIYQSYLRRWCILERFPQPDWSIVDLWVARELLSRGTFPAQVRSILQRGSPQFPRCHGDPEDYLRRTLARAAFPAAAPRARPV
jgi:hypothetical protein